MKKVLFFITKSNWGGAQKQVFDIASSLDKNLFHPVVACGGEGELVQQLKEKNIETVSLKNLERNIKIKKEIYSLLEIFTTLKKERPDILHLHSPKAGGLGSFAGRILGIKKIIYTSHGWSFNEDRNKLQKNLIKIFSWLTIIFTHHTVVLSKKEYAQVAHWPFVKNKLVIIPNGIRPGNYLSKEEARKKLESILKRQIPKDTFVIGTIAELHKNKGLAYAIEALSQIKECIYIIIGEGEEREKLETLISKFCTEHIFLTGKIQEAPSLLKAFDMFLLPSIKEGLPYVLLESGDAEVPVISTDVGSIDTLITAMESGILIPPKNPQEITEKIHYIQKNPLKLSFFGQNFKKHVDEKYSLSQMVERITSLYC